MRLAKAESTQKLVSFKVGCFEVKQLPAPEWDPKWSCYNTLTEVTHRTYGTREEVEEQLRLQSAIWERKQMEKDKKIKPRAGHAWRAVIGNETRQARKKKRG